MLVSHQLLLAMILLTCRIGERFSMTFIAQAAQSQYNLVFPEDKKNVREYRVPIVGSDSVWIDGSLIGNSAYSVDPLQGKITFFQPLPELAVIQVRYWILTIDSIEFDSYITRVKITPFSEKETIQMVARFDSTQDAPAGQWQISGVKTLGFSINNETGIGINQQTRLSLFGQVENLEIRGELSDQRLPTASEGTTLELEELDKIAISIRGNSWSGYFGDVGFIADAGSFGSLSREITGALLRAETRHFHSSFSYARPKGSIGMVTLDGIEGVQGPYILTVSGRPVQIIPGSEVVYLDGRRMVRGWDADYTIDYTTGELTFTNQNIITSRSRIVAEFQFLTYDYERTLLGGTFKGALNPVQLEIMFLREGDNPHRALSYDLTEEIRQRLASLDQDVVECWISGGEYVGEGRGEYILEDGHYRFTGANTGDYRVRFTFVGESAGTYVYDYLQGGFVFVGSGRGAYIDSVRVPLPKIEQSVYTRLGYSLLGLNGYVEGALMRRNSNLFSNRAVINNDGAVNYGFNWKGNILAMEYQHRSRDADFDFGSHLQDPEFAYRWGKIGEYTTLDELKIHVSPQDSIAVKGELGRLKRADGRYVDRWGADGRVHWFSFGGYRVADLLRLNAGIEPRLLIFTPLFKFEQEGDSRGRTRGWEAGLKLQPRSDVMIGTNFRSAEYEFVETLNLKRWFSTGRSQLLQVKYQQTWRDLFNINGVAGYQQFIDARTPGGWTKSFGSIHGGILIPWGLRTTFDLNRTNRRLQSKEEIFRYVGPNKGSYKRDTMTGSYFPSRNGDYERVVIYQGKFTEISDLSITLNTTLTGIRLLEIVGSCSRNSSYARTGELSGNNSYDLRLTWRGMKTLGELSAGVRGSQSFDRTLPISGRKFNEDRQFIEYSNSFSSDFELTVAGERKLLFRRLYSGELEYTQESKRIELSPIIGSRLRLEFGVEGELSLASEPIFYPELGKFRLVSVGAWITRSFALGYHTKFCPRAEIKYRSSDVPLLPYDIALSFPLGVTPEITLELDHLWNEVFSLTGKYGFSAQANRPPQHVFSLVLRANF